MRILVLWADESSTNLGVRTLAIGTSALVRRVWPDAEIVHQNFGQSNVHLPTGRLRTLVKERVLRQRGTRDWLAGFDLAIDTRSGDSFTDIYGLRRLQIMSAVAEFATQAGTPVVLGPQTLGPFDTSRGRAIGRFSMRRAALTMARDSVSSEYARTVGRPVDVLTTDVVFALPQPTPGRRRDVVLNISGLLWRTSPHVDAQQYQDVVTRVYQGLVASGRTVTLLAHVLESAQVDNDVPAIRDFAARHAPDVEIVIPADLDEVRSTVASADLVIGSRMHACLNALSVGTPAIPLAYSRKFEPLLSDLGWRRTVDLRISTDPVGDALALADTTTEDVSELRVRADELLRRAEAALETLR